MRNYCLLLFCLVLLSNSLFSQVTECIGFSYDDSGNRIKKFIDDDCDGVPLIRKDSIWFDEVVSLDDAAVGGKDNETGGSDDEKVSVLKSDISNSILIFPNPAKNTLFVRQEFDEILQGSIYSLDGRKVKKELKITPFSEVDISNLVFGLYLLEVKFKNGERLRFTFEKTN